ncbi:unnamed protein product [Calicophoron daubneyi]|uniref:Uncharacterized protein n=1 Tax=Calicophoron daubneyi TaxID=300641 RepID=A0AAV2T213_CALDB
MISEFAFPEQRGVIFFAIWIGGTLVTISFFYFLSRACPNRRQFRTFTVNGVPYCYPPRLPESSLPPANTKELERRHFGIRSFFSEESVRISSLPTTPQPRPLSK